nr:Rho termination factor N-terminal domain-containing protein [Actinomycetota bacterium]
MSEPQLERSVLEHKERDELHAIATAMGVKATTRTKKADLVDRILEATGVATSNGAAKADTPDPRPDSRPALAGGAVVATSEPVQH